MGVGTPVEGDLDRSDADGGGTLDVRVDVVADVDEFLGQRAEFREQSLERPGVGLARRERPGDEFDVERAGPVELSEFVVLGDDGAVREQPDAVLASERVEHPFDPRDGDECLRDEVAVRLGDGGRRGFRVVVVFREERREDGFARLLGETLRVGGEIRLPRERRRTGDPRGLGEDGLTVPGGNRQRVVEVERDSRGWHSREPSTGKGMRMSARRRDTGTDRGEDRVFVVGSARPSMTLDRVHVDGIARLASAIARAVDDADHGDLATEVWENFLDPLRDGSRVVVEPVGEKRLRSAPIEDVALAEPPFETTHGLDSGTINPTTFKNGLVLDVAQAAMAGVPSDLDLHRARTLVVTVHANDPTVDCETDWIVDDEGYSRRKVLHAPRVDRYAEGVVHALALYLAESEHALLQADTVDDLLVLDGPLYPMEVLTWQDGERELRDLVSEAAPRDVVENYVRLVETFVERDVPLVGFVKNPAARGIVRTLRKKGVEAPWTDDAALFTRLLERWDDEAGERRTDGLTFTNWFVSRSGTDKTMSKRGDALGIDRTFSPEDYEVAFLPVYDPRTDVLYRVESPAAFVRDEETRERLTQQVLHDVAVGRGPPPAVQKADELARVSQGEKAALRRKLEEYLDSDAVRRYDEERWGLS